MTYEYNKEFFNIPQQHCIDRIISKNVDRELFNTITTLNENDEPVFHHLEMKVVYKAVFSHLSWNEIQCFCKINDDMMLISPSIIEPISKMKVDNLGNHNPRLHVSEVLIALAISARTNPLAELAMKKISKLAHAQAHSTAIIHQEDEKVFKKLKIDLTTEPIAYARKLYVK